MQLFWYERLHLWQIHWKIRFWSAYSLLAWNHATVLVEPSLPDQHAWWTACIATLSLNFNFAHIFMPSKLLEMNAVTFSSVSSAYPLHYSGMETMQAVQSSVSVERQPGLSLHWTIIFFCQHAILFMVPSFCLEACDRDQHWCRWSLHVTCHSTDEIRMSSRLLPPLRWKGLWRLLPWYNCHSWLCFFFF